MRYSATDELLQSLSNAHTVPTQGNLPRYVCLDRKIGQLVNIRYMLFAAKFSYAPHKKKNGKEKMLSDENHMLHIHMKTRISI